MFPKHDTVTDGYLLLPGVAVAIAYIAFFAIPQHRERHRVSATTQQHKASVEKLDLVVKTQQQNASAHQTVNQQPDDLRAQHSTATREVSIQRKEQTFVQAFAVLLAIFDSHGVDCTAADPDKSDTGTKIDSAIAHRVSLDGRFGDALAAMEAIRLKLPHALATEVSMMRPDPLGQCHWKIAFSFEEDQ